MTKLLVDSRSAFHPCSALKEPKEIKNKLLLFLIREEHHTDSVTFFGWVPGSSHLADALTKYNQKIAGQF